MTQFESALQQVLGGTLKTPSVTYGNKDVDYFTYQLSVHHFNLKIMASGMLCRGIKLKDIKVYYGLKGKSAKDCLIEFEAILAEYKAKYPIRQLAKVESVQLN